MLSIIIPTLNEEKYLSRLIESIKKQNINDYEIIVSDAGSDDLTIEIAKKYSCRVINNHDRKHPSVQRNNGAKSSRGELLVFFDADTVLPKDFLSTAIEQVKERNLDIAGVYIKFNPNTCLYSIYSFFYNTFAFFRQYYSPISVGAGIFVKKELHNKIKGFDTRLYLAEDYDYCRRGGKLGRFRMIKRNKILYSSRRLQNEGKINGMLKWLQIAKYALFNKKITSKIINYEMGGRKYNN